MPKMENRINENPWGSPTLTLLKGFDVLNVLDVLNMLSMPIIGPIVERGKKANGGEGAGVGKGGGRGGEEEDIEWLSRIV